MINKHNALRAGEGGSNMYNLVGFLGFSPSGFVNPPPEVVRLFIKSSQNYNIFRICLFSQTHDHFGRTYPPPGKLLGWFATDQG